MGAIYLQQRKLDRARFFLETSLREDVNNNVQKLVGEQLQKQFDFFEQSSAASGQDYKFTTTIEHTIIQTLKEYHS